jgi:hypothetical protein
VLFDQTRKEYKADQIFEPDETVNLKQATAREIVRLLERYNLSDTSEDIKAHRSLTLETCLKIWKFSLQRDNDVEVLWRFPRSLDTMGTNRRSTLALIEKIA